MNIHVLKDNKNLIVKVNIPEELLSEIDIDYLEKQVIKDLNECEMHIAAENLSDALNSYINNSEIAVEPFHINSYVIDGEGFIHHNYFNVGEEIIDYEGLIVVINDLRRSVDIEEPDYDFDLMGLRNYGETISYYKGLKLIFKVDGEIILQDAIKGESKIGNLHDLTLNFAEKVEKEYNKLLFVDLFF